MLETAKVMFEDKTHELLLLRFLELEQSWSFIPQDLDRCSALPFGSLGTQNPSKVALLIPLYVNTIQYNAKTFIYQQPSSY